jgi:Ca2+-transporting ATPase
MRRPVPLSRLEGLGDGQRGLTAAEVEERRARYGANRILETPPTSWHDVLRDTARDPMVWFLGATALLYAWLGDVTESAVLALALLPIVGMYAYLHRRTQATTEGLRGRLASRAQALRDGAVTEIAATDLVPGDLVIVSASQPFPADGLILSGDGLQVDESTLTGEAMPVRKRPLGGAIGSGAEVAFDTIHWGAAGTRLLTGEATLRLIYTGGETLYGQIVRSAQRGRHERTPLQLAIGSLVTVLIVAASILCVALAATRYYQGYGALDAIVSAVTLAVAALPEEFPVVFTFFLGVGVYRLACRQALVRRAVVVENIGRVSCICSDKTGTLTEGQLRLAHRLPAPGVDEGRIIHIAAMASRAESGDPLDAALLQAAAPIEGSRIATFPFTEDRRREVAVIREPTGALLAAAKGAPETVFAMVRQGEEDRAVWRARIQELAATGHKVIACAWRRLDFWPGGEPDRDYEFAGLLAFEDPVREGVADAVAKARAAGIHVIMVTGDHPATAAAIAREIGIGADPPRVIEGVGLADYLGQNGPEALRRLDVVARAVPAQKLDLVRALQGIGEIVAVTGDGVNDVPALQGADIGIAMGERGTRTAREVAAIVLLDDNFRTIVRAIAEGRQLFRNLKLSFAYLLMVHMPLVVTAALVPFAGFPLLYLPAHIVWLELVIHPTALLVFQQLPATGDLAPVERRTRLRFLSPREWLVIGAVGAAVTAVIVFGYGRSLGADRNVEHARTMALVALVLAGAVITAGLSQLRSRGALIAVCAGIGSAIAFTQIPAVAAPLHLSPLHIDDWLVAALGGSLAGAPAAAVPLWQSWGRQRPGPPARRSSERRKGA